MIPVRVVLEKNIKSAAAVNTLKKERKLFF